MAKQICAHCKNPLENPQAGCPCAARGAVKAAVIGQPKQPRLGFSECMDCGAANPSLCTCPGRVRRPRRPSDVVTPVEPSPGLEQPVAEAPECMKCGAPNKSLCTCKKPRILPGRARPLTKRKTKKKEKGK